jgi:hypothetical protein
MRKGEQLRLNQKNKPTHKNEDELKNKPIWPINEG